MRNSLRLAMAAASILALTATETSAQVSGDVVRIGVLADMSASTAISRARVRSRR